MKTNKKDKFHKVFNKTWQAFKFVIPIIISILLIVAFVQAVVPVESYKKIFSGNVLLDPIVGAVFGSVSIGNPIVSYIIGEGLLQSGVSLIAVTAFIISWVTVGIVQLPAEAFYFGKRFAIVRNLSSFVGAIVIGILVGYIL